MLGLGAVDPYRRSIVNHDGVCWCGCRGGGHGHETRVEAHCTGGVQGDRLAWLREGRLRDGMVVGGKLELNHVAYIGLDVVR